MIKFGSGDAWLTPLTPNPTPVHLAHLKEASIDLDVDIKSLYGKGRFPIAHAGGEGKLEFKGKDAQVSSAAMNILMNGGGLTDGLIAITDVYAALVPDTPFSLTPTVPDGGSFDADLGVRGADGFPWVRVASNPSAKQYAVNTTTGAYTFAAANVGTPVYISFAHRKASADGAMKRMKMSNITQGALAHFRLDYFTEYDGKQFVFIMFSVAAGKFGMSFKSGDFSVPEFNLSAMEDGNGDVFEFGAPAA